MFDFNSLQESNVSVTIKGKDLFTLGEVIASKLIEKDEKPIVKDEFIDRPTLKQRFDIKADATVIRYEKLGFLKPYRIGGKIRYKESEAEASLKSLSR